MSQKNTIIVTTIKITNISGRILIKKSIEIVIAVRTQEIISLLSIDFKNFSKKEPK